MRRDAPIYTLRVPAATGMAGHGSQGTRKEREWEQVLSGHGSGRRLYLVWEGVGPWETKRKGVCFLWLVGLAMAEADMCVCVDTTTKSVFTQYKDVVATRTTHTHVYSSMYGTYGHRHIPRTK